MKKYMLLFLILAGIHEIQAMQSRGVSIIRAEGQAPRYISYRRSIVGNPIHTTIRYFPADKTYKIYEEVIAPGEESAPEEEVYMVPGDAARLYENFSNLYDEQENKPKIFEINKKQLLK